MRIIIAGVSLLALMGCATSHTDYTPPSALSVKNSATLDKPFDVVWDRMVKNLSSDFFVINNIDKNSRLINISFSSNRPSEFVNCGRTTRSFSNLRGSQDASYDPADSSDFMLTDARHIAYRMVRTTRLDGRSNIYVAPEGSGTNVTVNTKYVLGITAAATNIEGRSVGSNTYAVDFSTKSASVATGSAPSCISNGAVESKIFGFASGLD
jgi:hypothetical protein